MDPFSDYAFDVRGWVHVPNALSAGQLTQARKAAASSSDLGWLADTEAAASRASALCQVNLHGGNLAAPQLRPAAALSVAPRVVAPPPSAAGELALGSGGGVRRERSVAYFHRQGVRVVQAVRAVWALEDASAEDTIVFVPCSHRAQLEAPVALLAGKDDMSWLGEPLYHRLSLNAGDLLLFSPALLHKVSSNGSSRLIECEYITNTVSPGRARRPEHWFYV